MALTLEQWCAKYGNDSRVLQWLADNSPPDGWRDTPCGWAYLEMPAGIFTQRPGKIL